MSKLYIDEPCTESWEGMEKREAGNFCGKCCKMVIDFTNKTTDEILEFLKLRSGQKVCGRLQAEALSPVPVFNRPVRRRRTFLWALLLVFGGLLFTSCHSRKRSKEVYGGMRVFDGFAKEKVAPVKAAGLKSGVETNYELPESVAADELRINE